MAGAVGALFELSDKASDDVFGSLYGSTLSVIPDEAAATVGFPEFTTTLVPINCF